MTNTERYFKDIEWFRRDLREIDARYKPRFDELERHKGSEYYRDEYKHLTDMRAAEVAELRAESIKRLETVCDDMERTYKEKPAPTPTGEQLAILQALKMRDHVSLDELRQTANNVKGCATAERIIEEIARKGGHTLTLAPEVSSDYIKSRIHALRVSGGTMMRKLEHCDSRKEFSNSANWDMFRWDTDPVDEMDALRVYGSVTGAEAEQFSAEVNGK